MLKSAAFFLIFLTLSSTADADWLGGPDNFDACVAEGMKGQNLRMFNTVSRACEWDFEIKLDYQVRRLVDLDWTTSNKSNVTVSIGTNDSDYKITRAFLAFSIKPCGDAQDADFDVPGEADFSHWRPGAKPKLDAKIEVTNASDLKCMKKREVFGKRYK